MKKCLIASAAAAAFLFTAQANADVLATLVSGPNGPGGSTYSFTAPIVAGVNKAYTLGDTGTGSGLSFPTGTHTTFTVRNVNQATSGAAITAVDYVTWGLTFAEPYNLDDFSIRFDKDANGADDVILQLSVNGGAYANVLTDTAVNAAGEEHLNVSLATFDNVSSFVMRAVLFNATTQTGIFDFENSANIGNGAFRLNGTPVPEPATAGLLGLAGLAMLRRRRA